MKLPFYSILVLVLNTGIPFGFADTYKSFPKSVEKRIKELQKINLDHPEIIVGKLIVDHGKANARDVFSQMPIDEQGYFISAIKDHEHPVGFFLEGYLPAQVNVKNFTPSSVIDVGEVHLKPLTKEQRSQLKGKLVVKESASLAKIRLEPWVLTNTLHGGIEKRSYWKPRKKKEIRVDSNGNFSAEGLNPGIYQVTALLEHYYPVTREIVLEPGKISELTIELTKN